MRHENHFGEDYHGFEGHVPELPENVVLMNPMRGMVRLECDPVNWMLMDPATQHVRDDDYYPLP